MRIPNQRIKTAHKSHKSHKPQRAHTALVLGLVVATLTSPFQSIQVYAAESTAEAQSDISIYGSTTYRIDDTTEIVYSNVISYPYEDTLEIAAAAPPTEIPTKENYTFLGWHYASSVEEHNLTSSYEEFNSPYGITYVKDIVSSTSDGTKAKVAIDEEENRIFSSVMRPNEVTPTNYEFYATWGRIKYDTNGGKFKDGSTEKYTSVESTPANFSESNQYELAKYYTKEFITEKPTREGYIFLGWSPTDKINGHNTYDETNWNPNSTPETIKPITNELLFQDTDGYVKYIENSYEVTNFNAEPIYTNLALTSYDYFTENQQESRVDYPTEYIVYAVWIKESLMASNTKKSNSTPSGTPSDTPSGNESIPNTDTTDTTESYRPTSPIAAQIQNQSIRVDESIPAEDIYVGNEGPQEVTKSAQQLFQTVVKTVKIVLTISLILPLIGLAVLLFLKEKAKKVAVKNDVNTDEYNSPNFKTVKVLKARSEGNPIAELKRDNTRVWSITIPEQILAERVTDSFELELTKVFSKHYHGEEIMVILDSVNDTEVKTFNHIIDSQDSTIKFSL